MYIHSCKIQNSFIAEVLKHYSIKHYQCNEDYLHVEILVMSSFYIKNDDK